MITKCTNCGSLLECGQPPGSIVDCASCGKPFEAYPAKPIDSRRVPVPPPASGKMQGQPFPSAQVWKDDYRVLLYYFLAVAAGVFGGLMLGENAILAVSLVFGVAVSLWVIALLRACAYRLMHIEELLSRR